MNETKEPIGEAESEEKKKIVISEETIKAAKEATETA
jgi:hypothetical protein